MSLNIQKGSEISHITMPFSFSLGSEECFKVMAIKEKSEINLVLVMRIFFILFKRLRCEAELNEHPPCTPRVAGAQGLLTPESQTGDGEKPHGSPGPTPSTTQALSTAGAGTRKHPETDKQCLQNVC